MLSLNEIIEPIESALIQWIQQFPEHLHIKQLQDLTDGHFFIHILKKVKGFKLNDYLSEQVLHIKKQASISLSLSEKIKRMRSIWQSLMKHYKQQLNMEIDQIQFNYIEISKDNKEQLIRLFIYFMGVAVRQKDIVIELQQYINSQKCKNSDFLKIMVEYAKNISIDSLERQIISDSPLKKQKRLINKLQILQDQIQFYEDYTKQLQQKLLSVQQQYSKLNKKRADVQRERVEILKRVEELQQVNERIMSQLRKAQMKQQILNAKIKNDSLATQQAISRLVQEIQSIKQEYIYYRDDKFKSQYYLSLNLKLNKINQELQLQNNNLNNKVQQYNDNLAIKQQHIKQMQDQNQYLIIENDSLKTQIDLLQKLHTKSQQYSYLSLNPSFNHHQPLKISNYNTQEAFKWLHQENKMENYDGRNDSLTLTIKSRFSACNDGLNPTNLSSFNSNKQNDINDQNFMLLKSKESHNLNKTARVKHSIVDNVIQDNSLQINLQQYECLMMQKQSMNLQLQLLIVTLSDLYKHYESIRKQLNRYKLDEFVRRERKSIFINKVEKMFEWKQMA